MPINPHYIVDIRLTVSERAERPARYSGVVTIDRHPDGAAIRVRRDGDSVDLIIPVTHASSAPQVLDHIILWLASTPAA
jgi:hypothetical protein